MVLVSAADRNRTDRELHTIGRIVTQAPTLDGFDTSGVSGIANCCLADLEQEDGLDTVLGLIAEALPRRLRETAYAFAVEVAVADGTAATEEPGARELIRHRLEVDRLAAAAIERSAEVRSPRLG